MAADTLAVDELIEDLKHLYPGRRRAPYDTEARMYDVIGKHATPYQGKHAGRTNTPDEILPDGARVMRVKRVCDGCSEVIGDATEAEVEAAYSGRELPSVIAEHGCGS